MVSLPAANEIKFYLDPAGKVFAVTRGTGGNEATRGVPHVNQAPPPFDGHWVWTDANGEHPKVSLFSNKYSAANPYLEPLDKSYRVFALAMRDGTCMRCHTPNNRTDANRLVLFQTPAHAAAEIDNVLKVVRNGDMPQNDWGAKSELDPRMRTTLLTSGEAFSKIVSEANR